MRQAWEATNAFGVAELVWALDADDPCYEEYLTQMDGCGPREVAMALPEWRPMVTKLDRFARALAVDDHQAIGFMGDDHVPRTDVWAQRLLAELRDMGTGIVYGDDLLQREVLPTQWVMTADIVRALRRMVPAPVGHLYCDNAVLALGRALRRIRYVGDVVIEHMHPLAGKVEPDPQYERVNSDAQRQADRHAYMAWMGAEGGLAADVECVKRECGLS